MTFFKSTFTTVCTYQSKYFNSCKKYTSGWQHCNLQAWEWCSSKTCSLWFLCGSWWAWGGVSFHRGLPGNCRCWWTLLEMVMAWSVHMRSSVIYTRRDFMLLSPQQSLILMSSPVWTAKVLLKSTITCFVLFRFRVRLLPQHQSTGHLPSVLYSSPSIKPKFRTKLLQMSASQSFHLDS